MLGLFSFYFFFSMTPFSCLSAVELIQEQGKSVKASLSASACSGLVPYCGQGLTQTQEVAVPSGGLKNWELSIDHLVHLVVSSLCFTES